MSIDMAPALMALRQASSFWLEAGPVHWEIWRASGLHTPAAFGVGA